VFAYNWGTAATIASRFSGYCQGAPEMILGAKKLGIVGRESDNWYFFIVAAAAG